MSLDFWSARSSRYHTRRFAFVRKLKSSTTPLRFAGHRRNNTTSKVSTNYDEEESDNFDSVEHYRKLAEEKLMADLRIKLLAEQSFQREAAEQAPEIVVSETPAEENKFEKSMEPIFACYYKPQITRQESTTEFPPSPPLTPLSAEQIIDRAISAAVARRCAGQEKPWAAMFSATRPKNMDRRFSLAG